MYVFLFNPKIGGSYGQKNNKRTKTKAMGK